MCSTGLAGSVAQTGVWTVDTGLGHLGRWMGEMGCWMSALKVSAVWKTRCGVSDLRIVFSAGSGLRSGWMGEMGCWMSAEGFGTRGRGRCRMRLGGTGLGRGEKSRRWGIAVLEKCHSWRCTCTCNLQLYVCNTQTCFTMVFPVSVLGTFARGAILPAKANVCLVDLDEVCL
jgi:hypothetical protein